MIQLHLKLKLNFLLGPLWLEHQWESEIILQILKIKPKRVIPWKLKNGNCYASLQIKLWLDPFCPNHSCILSGLDGWVLLGLDAVQITFFFSEQVWLFSEEKEAPSKLRVIFIFIRFISWCLRARTHTHTHTHTHTESDTAEQTPLCSLCGLNNLFSVKSRSMRTRGKQKKCSMTVVEKWYNQNIMKKFCSTRKQTR